MSEQTNKTVVIDEETYLIDELTEEAKKLLADIGVVELKMQDYQTSYNIALLAKNTLLEKLAEEKKNLTPTSKED